MHQEAMNWFTWLSKTHLEPPFIHEYAITFSHNQLEEEDISYFNHEFLQSMGISIAKHRLEILKLARKSTSNGGISNPISKLIIAIKKTNRTVARLVRNWVHRNDSALIMVKKRSYSSRWKTAMLKRNSRLAAGGGSTTLLLTSGRHRPPVVVRSGGAKVNSFSGPLVYTRYHDQDDHGNGGGAANSDVRRRRRNSFSDNEDGGDGGGGYWSSRGVEEIKWDAMFQNLKPT